jgi:CheY-like chemotaxis protein
MSRVLLVDDDAQGLEIRKLLLEHAGHDVIAFSDPGVAIAACLETSLDVAVIDLRLPEVHDGLALIRALRDAHTDLRLVVLCGLRSDIDDRPERGMVDEVLTKPVRAEKLLAAVTIKAPA